MTVIRIVPPESDTVNGEPTYMRTRGTRCFIGDQEVSVSRIVLTAELNNVWRATIDTHAIAFEEIRAHLDGVNVTHVGPHPIRARLRAWLQRLGVNAS